MEKKERSIGASSGGTIKTITWTMKRTMVGKGRTAATPLIMERSLFSRTKSLALCRDDDDSDDDDVYVVFA